MRHKLFDSRKKLVIFIIVVFSLFAIGLTLSLFSLAKAIDTQSAGQAFAGTVGSVATLLGSIIIMFQLRGEAGLNCAKMLSDLNFSFIENERLMLVYRELQKAYNDPNYRIIFDNEDPNRMHDEDLMAYMTFYETLNEYYHHGVLTIGQMNDLFGDRFFKLIHNKDVQERELYSEPSSYVNIFELYASWISYRKKCEANGEGRISVRSELAIPDIYIKNKTYMKESARFTLNEKDVVFTRSNNEQTTLKIRRLYPRDYQAFKALQDEIIENLPNKELFVPTTDDEFYESCLVDYCAGLFLNNKLVAVSIFVLNRKDPRNLCSDLGNKLPVCDYITFDTIQVSPSLRGFKIQKFFLEEADRVTKEVGAKYVLATVSPENHASKNNFLEYGYEVAKEMKKYNNLTRLLVKREVL